MIDEKWKYIILESFNFSHVYNLENYKNSLILDLIIFLKQSHGYFSNDRRLPPSSSHVDVGTENFSE